MTVIQIAGVAITLMIAGFLQGLTGFGFGLTAMALLPLVVNLADAQAIVTVVNIPACVVNATALRRHVYWRDCVGLLSGTMIGVPLGFWFLTALPLPIVKQCLGAALCGMVLFDLLLARGQGFRYPFWSSPLIGLIGGSLGGAFNIGGPPLVAYLYSQPWPKQRVVAALSVVFLANGLLRFTLLAMGDYLTADVWIPSAWSVLPMLLATIGGHRLLHHVPRERLKTGVYAVLLMIGAGYLFS